MAKGSMPVLVGVGQTVSHWTGADGGAGAPSPLSLAADASQRALADTGAGDLAAALDTIAVVRTNEDSVPWETHPFGNITNWPRTLARELGANPATAIYSAVGGQTPQALVNEMAARIHDGESDLILIAGSEAIGAAKAAKRAGLTLDWADGAEGPVEERTDEERMLSRHEIKHGLVAPAYFYALIETAIAAREQRSRSQHRAAMSALFAPFSEVAAVNPFAQFQTARSADWLATPSQENYELADPFLKWHVAQDAVNLGAAVLLLSEDKADAFGIAPDKRVYLHGSGEAGDDHISVRPIIDGSWAMAEAMSRALNQAGKTAGDMALFDLYSCFPCAVFSACQALGLDWRAEPRPLTVTGGLPFFGGPGNNYSLHGIASMTERLRAAPGDFGLVLANGGWLTKEAAGVYSTARPDAFTPVASMAKPKERVKIDPAPTGGVLETYTVLHGREGPHQAIAFIRTEDGRRYAANGDEAAIAALREDENQAGRPVTSTQENEVNTFTFA